MPFTDKFISGLRPKQLRYEIPEPGRTGLSIRVTPHGVKSWAFRYRFHGDRKRILFGAYPTLSLADAHVKVADAKKQLESGHDPGVMVNQARAVIRTATTTDELITKYLEHADKSMRPATAKEDRRILNKEVLPYWSGRLAKDITRQDVMELLKDIEKREVYVLRNRVAGVLSRCFLFGLDEGLIDASPAIKLRRLKKIHNQKVEKARSNFLTQEQIRNFWNRLDTVPLTPSMRLALKWALVTGQRRGEVASTPRIEIDEREKLWTIPATRTKNGKLQLLPLPAFALELLHQADAARVRPQPTRMNRKDRKPYDPNPSPWLFPSVRYGKHITPAALTYAVVRHRAALGIGHATVHDLRRTMATWLGELGAEKDLISALLNHAPKGVTDTHYNKASMLGPKTEAMQTWCRWLGDVIAGKQQHEKVVPITRRKG